MGVGENLLDGEMCKFAQLSPFAIKSGKRRELHFTPPLSLTLVFAQESRLLGAIEFRHFCRRFPLHSTTPPPAPLQFNHRKRDRRSATYHSDGLLAYLSLSLPHNSLACLLPFVDDGRLLTVRIRVDGAVVRATMSDGRQTV